MIYIFTGEINSGKTNSLLKWSKEKPYIFGILTPKNEKRERYFLDLNSVEKTVKLTTQIRSKLTT